MSVGLATALIKDLLLLLVLRAAHSSVSLQKRVPLRNVTNVAVASSILQMQTHRRRSCVTFLTDVR